MKTYEFTIDNNLCDAIEEKASEVEGYTNLYIAILELDNNSIPKVKLDELKKEYFNCVKEFNLYKQMITDLIPEEFDRNKTSWKLDYNTCKVYVTEQDEEEE